MPDRSLARYARDTIRCLLALMLIAALSAMQRLPSLPFAAGEHLMYSVHAGPGMNGQGEMWIEGPVDVRGTPAIVLNSKFGGGFGPFKVSNRTTSWFDAEHLASLRFVKSEHSPLGGTRSEDVEINPAAHNWRSADGHEGALASAQPLDELSFIYVLRTLDVPSDSVLVLNRHFDAARNPTTFHFLGKGAVKIGDVNWVTREVEMHVRDSGHYRGEGIIRISLSDDACRRPVRIESTMPNAGTIVMLLQSAVPVITECEGASTR